MANNNKIISISCGNLHSLFIDKYQRLLVSGYNFSGQCGISSTIEPRNNIMDEYEPSTSLETVDYDENIGWNEFIEPDSEE